jgi:hypothetical protein
LFPDSGTPPDAGPVSDASSSPDVGPVTRTDPFGLDLEGVHVALPPFTVLVDGVTSTVVGGELALAARVGAGDATGVTWAWTLPAGVTLAPGASATSATASFLFATAGEYLLGVTATRGSDVVTGGALVHVHAADPPALGTLTGGPRPTAADVALLAAYLAGQGTLTRAQSLAADLDLDGRVGRSDLELLERAAALTATAPVHVTPLEGATLSTVMVVHAALLDPAASVTVRLVPTTAGTWDAACLAAQDGKPHSAEATSSRSRPGYLVFSVPARYHCLTGAETVRVELDVGGTTHVAVNGFRVVPLPAVSDHPGAPVMEAMGRLRLALAALPAAAASYADQVGATQDEKAFMQGTAQRSAEWFTEVYKEFFLAFQQLDAPTRGVWEQLARAQGLDDALEELRALTPGVTFIPGQSVPPPLSPAQAQAIINAICDFNRVADVASKVADINDTIAGALEYLDWFPLNKAPVVGPAISFLSTASNIVSVITDMIGAVAAYVPALGDEIQVRSAPAALNLAASTTLSAHLEIRVASGLCDNLTGAAVGSLVDSLKDTLARKLASKVPYANRAFKKAKYDRDEMNWAVGKVYDAISWVAGKIIDASGLEGYLENLAKTICEKIQDPSLPVELDSLTAGCGSVNQDAWTCTAPCSGYPQARAVAFSGEKSICREPKPARGQVTCLGEPPPVCGNGTVERGEQCEGQAGCLSPSVCNRECQCVEANVCPNGIIDPGEECDGAADCPQGKRCMYCECVEIVCAQDNECPDMNPDDCQVPFCDDATHRCAMRNQDYYEPCREDLCRQGDRCQEDGSCSGGYVTSCNNYPGVPACFNPAACNPADGQCTYVPRDGIACSRNDQCPHGPCDPSTCTCTVLCTPLTSCDDGDACTLGDMCDADGTCQPGPPLQCSDPSPSDLCVQAPSVCRAGLCVGTPRPAGRVCGNVQGCYRMECNGNGACEPALYCATPANTCQVAACLDGTECGFVIKEGAGCDENEDCAPDRECNMETCQCWVPPCGAYGTWPDPVTGLVWARDTSGAMGTWANAMNRCAAAASSTGLNWRLPNITELRSLLRGCPDTVAGGACPVSPQCSNTDDQICWLDSCGGCSYAGGPGLVGTYRDPCIQGGYTDWSSTEAVDNPEAVWVVNHIYGEVTVTSKTESKFGRCVRGP